jgi:hypothetical protein
MAYQNSDAQEVSELLDAVSSKAPDLIRNLLKTVYSAEAGRHVGEAVGGLYQELLAAGIPAEMALKMAGDYMISFKDLLGVLKSSGGFSSSTSGAPEPDDD